MNIYLQVIGWLVVLTVVLLIIVWIGTRRDKRYLIIQRDFEEQKGRVKNDIVQARNINR